MYKYKKIIAVVTARGGSKGLPGKNIRPLCGKPLIVWTLEHAKKSVYIDDVFVSTDSSEIVEICEQCGVSVPHLRPAHLATDDASSVDVVKFTLDYLQGEGFFYDYVLLLQPTSPLRKDSDLDAIIEFALQNPEADGAITVATDSHEHPLYAKKIGINGYMHPYIACDKSIHQRQLLDKALYVYGSMFLIKTEVFFEKKALYTDKILPFPLERWQCYEIDDLYDFVCVEAVLKYIRNEK